MYRRDDLTTITQNVDEEDEDNLNFLEDRHRDYKLDLEENNEEDE